MWEYLKDHRKIGLFLVTAAAVEGLVFWLYHLPAAAVAYASVIIAFFGMALAVPDFLGYRRRHQALLRMREEIGVSTENLPVPAGLLERDYHALTESLFLEESRREDQREERMRELTDYYTIWAHQIKTPIAAMRLNLQGQDTAVSRELSEELQRIEQYAEMVLVVLRLDSSTTDYVIRECALDEILKQAIKKFKSQFIRRKIRLVYEPSGCRVLSDEKWLQFVIEQVLSNALKYTPAGTVSIEVLPGSVLCIRDTGIGIAPEDLPRIFEKGYTGENGRLDKRASGIGLYLCSRICENLGHRIRAESAVGQGTRVYLELKPSGSADVWNLSKM